MREKEQTRDDHRLFGWQVNGRFNYTRRSNFMKNDCLESRDAIARFKLHSILILHRTHAQIAWNENWRETITATEFRCFLYDPSSSSFQISYFSFVILLHFIDAHGIGVQQRILFGFENDARHLLHSLMMCVAQSPKLYIERFSCAQHGTCRSS